MAEEGGGVIGKMMEGGLPIIYSFDSCIPEIVVESFPLLVVLKWEYKGNDNNGMPSKSDQEKIYQLSLIHI